MGISSPWCPLDWDWKKKPFQGREPRPFGRYRPENGGNCVVFCRLSRLEQLHQNSQTKERKWLPNATDGPQLSSPTNMIKNLVPVPRWQVHLRLVKYQITREINTGQVDSAAHYEYLDPTCLTRRNPWYKTCPRSSSWYFSCSQSQNTEPNNLMKQVHFYSTKHFICAIFIFAINKSNGIHSHSFRSIVTSFTSFPHIFRPRKTFIRCDFSHCPSAMDVPDAEVKPIWAQPRIGFVFDPPPMNPTSIHGNLQAAERRSASTADTSWCLAARQTDSWWLFCIYMGPIWDLSQDVKCQW